MIPAGIEFLDELLSPNTSVALGLDWRAKFYHSCTV